MGRGRFRGLVEEKKKGKKKRKKKRGGEGGENKGRERERKKGRDFIVTTEKKNEYAFGPENTHIAF